MSRNISKNRKTAHSVGIGFKILGGLLLASSFLLFAWHFGDHTPGIMKSTILISVVGFVLLITGGIIQTISAKGLAGSGVLLDPEKARDELEPYSRMAGGMVKDALDEAKISLGGKSQKVIMMKCLACGKLNESDSKFCQECAKKI